MNPWTNPNAARDLFAPKTDTGDIQASPWHFDMQSFAFGLIAAAGVVAGGNYLLSLDEKRVRT